MQFDCWRFWRCYLEDWRSRDRRRLKWPWNFRWDSLRRSCRCMSSRFVRAKGTSGRRDIGVGAGVHTFSTWGTGDRWWDSMAELITAGATTDADIMVDGGIADIF